MCWPWGAYLGDEAMKNGHAREDLLLAARCRPTVIPHAAKATGIYLNSMLAVHRGAEGAATRRRSCSPSTASSPTAPARTSSSSRTGRSTRPTSRPSILPGSRATRSSRSRTDLGYPVVEKALIRSDLYVADELFMTRHRRRGHADQLGRRPRGRRSGPDHARDPDGVPRHRARRAATAGRTGSTTSRRRAAAGVSAARGPSRSRAPYLDEREEELVLEVLRSGPALARPDDRPLRGALRRDASARRTRPPSRAAPPGSTCSAASPASGRATRRSPRRTPSPPRRTASSTRARRRSSPTSIRGRSTSTRPRSRPRSRERTRAIVAVDIFGYPCELDPLRELCGAARADADPGLLRGARRAIQGRARSAPTAPPRSSPSTRTSR